MRTTRTLVAATAIGLAAAVAAGPALGAPAKKPTTATKAKAKANAKVIKQIRTQARAYSITRTHVAACARPNSVAPAALRARAKTTLGTTAKARTKALRGVKASAPTRTLTAKRNQMANTNKTLRAVARLCATAGVPVPGTSTAPIAPSGPPVVITVPGGSTTAQPVDLSLRNVLGGTPIDLSSLLGPGGVLPSTLSLVGLDQLLGGVVGEGGLIGVDPQALLNLINGGVYNLTACGLLDLGCITNSLLGTTNDALAGVTSILNGAIGGAGLGDLNDLLRVERVSDTVVRLVPVGDLATLLNGVGGIDALLAGLAGTGDLNTLLNGLIRL